MSSFHWLHFSDLHLTLDADENFNTQYARKQLLAFLNDETDAGRLPYDCIFMTGDLAHKCNYDGVSKHIQHLFTSLKWKWRDYDRAF